MSTVCLSKLRARHSAQERIEALTLQKRSVHLRAIIEAVRERLDDHVVPASSRR